jgi:hypothetical protein
VPGVKERARGDRHRPRAPVLVGRLAPLAHDRLGAFIARWLPALVAPEAMAGEVVDLVNTTVEGRERACPRGANPSRLTRPCGFPL